MRVHDYGWKGALAVLFLALAAVAVQSARLGASGFHAQLAHQHMQQSAAAAAPHVRESLAYFPANPSALDLSGALAIAKMRASRAPAEALGAAQEARGHFRRALLERPTSPFVWANLALAKLYLDEFDQEMLAALRQADTLGPWEPAVQQATVFVGLAGWRKLDTGAREALARTIERAGLRNAARMYDVLKSYGRFDLVCGMASYRSLAGGNCARSQQ